MNFIRSILRFFHSPMSTGKGRTVRYMFPLLVGFAAILSAQLISSVETSYIRLAVDKQTVLKDERFSIDVYAYAHVPVNAIDLTLEFDGSKVQVLEVDRGQSVLTIWTQDPVITNNTVTLRGGTFRKGFLGEHKIARIDLKAKNTGNSEFSASEVMLLAGDGKGTPVKTSNSDTSVSLFIYDENTNPEDIKIDVKINLVTDLDGDGKVTLKDISAFMSAWASNSNTLDFNGDGRMNFRDFSIILANFFFQ